jgi:hypothetical protein
VKGLAFLGFPLHPAGKPSVERAEHLRDVKIPMLFLQGTRDELAKLELLQPVIDGLGTRATLKRLPDAGHSFHVPARTGRKDPEVRAEMLDALAAWAAQTLRRHERPALHASTIGLNPPQPIRPMSKGIFFGSIISAIRGSAITFFMTRLRSAFDL